MSTFTDAEEHACQALIQLAAREDLDLAGDLTSDALIPAKQTGAATFVARHPGRFLFGSDLVTRHGLVRDHYRSRYWCQRTLWESAWEGPSPIADPDYDGPGQPPLRGVDLPADVLRQIYRDNAARVLPNKE